jgi:hypothetical protein
MLTVFDNSVAKAIEITGTTTPVIVGLIKELANWLPSAARPTAPYSSMKVANPKLMFSQNKNASKKGTTATSKNT